MSRSYRLFGSARSDFLRKERYENPYDLLEEDRYPNAFKPRMVKSSAFVRRRRSLNYVHYSFWQKQAAKYVGMDSSNFYDIALNRKLVGINSIKRAVFSIHHGSNSCIWIEIPNEQTRRELRQRSTFLAPYLPSYSTDSPYLGLMRPNQLVLDEDNIIHQIPDYSIESSGVGGFYKVIVSDDKIILQHPLKGKVVDVGHIEIIKSDEENADFSIGIMDYNIYAISKLRHSYAIVPIPKSITDRFDRYYSSYVLNSRRPHWLYVPRESALKVLPLKLAKNHAYWKFLVKPIEKNLGTQNDTSCSK